MLPTWSTAHLATPMSAMLQSKAEQGSSSGIISCLHLGCTRQYPTVDVADLVKTTFSRNSKRQSLPNLKGAVPMDPTVAAALQRLDARSALASAADYHHTWLLLGADASPPPRAYPGVAVTTDLHFPWYARSRIRSAFTSQPSLSTVGSPLFDVLLSDALSPELEFSTTTPRLATLDAPVEKERGLSLIALTSTSTPSSLFASSLASKAMSLKGPVRDDALTHVTDPLLASLSVGLPLLSRDSLAVVRLSRHDKMFSKGTTAAAIRTLRQRFANVDFFRDDFGMIALCCGSSVHAGHVLCTPHNIREDFPGFARASQTKQRPRKWEHYSNPLATKNTFFMALHPAFDKAPPPDVLAAKLAREKEAEARQDERDGVFMDAVSQTLDTFETGDNSDK
jgi:hypothetical protein